MYLRDIAIYADEGIVSNFPSGFVGWFHRETCCITELYLSLLWRKVRTPDTTKVHLEFMQQGGFAPTLRQLLGVADARWHFDFSGYHEQDDAGKKRLVLDALVAALLWIANEREWDTGPFEDCRAEVIRHELNFEGWSKKSWVSPNRRYRAKIAFRWELRKVNLSVGVFDRRGRELGRKPFFSVVPEMGVLDPILKATGMWRRNNVFRLKVADIHFYVPKTPEVDLSDIVAGEK